eukprot:GFUD01072400.1.p1 GENE.GFUD01072400.1~~GFUD01072400.1.p1  ORF type:complete len:102 (-),score=0.57 GFUD01072400.1:121-426(-)
MWFATNGLEQILQLLWNAKRGYFLDTSLCTSKYKCCTGTAKMYFLLSYGNMGKLHFVYFETSVWVIHAMYHDLQISLTKYYLAGQSESGSSVTKRFSLFAF